jgi:hypothetical protein
MDVAGLAAFLVFVEIEMQESKFRWPWNVYFNLGMS